MDVAGIPSHTKSRSATLWRLGLACWLSGVLGVLAAILTLTYSPAVPDDQWSYPFTVGVGWTLSVVLAITHALTMAGFIGLLVARPQGPSRWGRYGLWASVVGFALLVPCELLSGAIGDDLTNSSAATWVGSAFGVASLLTGIGSIVAGVAILRAEVWHGLAASLVLVSGLIMILIVTPASAADAFVPDTIGLLIWSAVFIPLGRAVQTSRSTLS